ncbi:hypothetical protein RJT34_12988 [Clitoria ternatea]|uniref:Bifunctional inhibitor/plant lipid transfer protein/seed storage helical domain-containing protein n=1 Tax=Clitoria ternatea TaxID=43366 RepID=A0AAN9JN79_CLITE
MAVTKVTLVASLMACMLMAYPYAEQTLTCDQVTIWLTPCIPYGVMGGNVSSLCCQGIYSLNAAYKNGDDRRGACQCIQDRAAYIPGLDYNRINEIPGKCGTKCPYKVYPTTNCSNKEQKACDASWSGYDLYDLLAGSAEKIIVRKINK